MLTAEPSHRPPPNPCHAAHTQDWILGHRDAVMAPNELRAMVQLHGESAGLGGRLSAQEVAVMQAAMDMRRKTALAAMTPLEHVFAVDGAAALDGALVGAILASGHSRVPVRGAGGRGDLVGLVLVKEILRCCFSPAAQPGSFTAAAAAGALPPAPAPAAAKGGACAYHAQLQVQPPPRVEQLALRPLPRLPADTPLFDVLRYFQTGHSHMALLVAPAGVDPAELRRRRAWIVSQDGGRSSGGGGGKDVDGSAALRAGGDASSDGGSGGSRDGCPSSVASAGDGDDGSGARRRRVRKKGSGGSGGVVAKISSELAQLLSLPSLANWGGSRAGSLRRGGKDSGSDSRRSGSGSSSGSAGRRSALFFFRRRSESAQQRQRRKDGSSEEETEEERVECRVLSFAGRRAAEAIGVEPADGGPFAQAAVRASARFSSCSGRSSGGGGGGGTANVMSPLAPAALPVDGFDDDDLAAAKGLAAAAAAGAAGAAAAAAAPDAAEYEPIGIITLEDVIEQLTGDILDETDRFVDAEKTRRADLASALEALPPHLQAALRPEVLQAASALLRLSPAGGGAGGGGGSASVVAAAAARKSLGVVTPATSALCVLSPASVQQRNAIVRAATAGADAAGALAAAITAAAGSGGGAGSAGGALAVTSRAQSCSAAGSAGGAKAFKSVPLATMSYT